MNQKTLDAFIAAKEKYRADPSPANRTAKEKATAAYLAALEEHAQTRTAPDGPGDATVSF